MAKKIKVKITESPIASRAELEGVVGKIAQCVILREAHIVDMEDQIARIRKSYEARFCKADEEIKTMSASVKTWCDSHPEEFQKKKTIEMLHAVIGYRTCPPKLKTLAKWTWEKVKEALIERDMGFIRTKTEVDKEGLLAKSDALGAELSNIGLKLVQDEMFFIEPKREGPTTGGTK